MKILQENFNLNLESIQTYNVFKLKTVLWIQSKNFNRKHSCIPNFIHKLENQLYITLTIVTVIVIIADRSDVFRTTSSKHLQLQLQGCSYHLQGTQHWNIKQTNKRLCVEENNVKTKFRNIFLL